MNYILWRDSHFLSRKPRKPLETFKRICKHCWDYLEDDPDTLTKHITDCKRWPTIDKIKDTL
jgi:hypothetical protein